MLGQTAEEEQKKKKWKKIRGSGPSKPKLERRFQQEKQRGSVTSNCGDRANTDIAMEFGVGRPLMLGLTLAKAFFEQ